MQKPGSNRSTWLVIGALVVIGIAIALLVAYSGGGGGGGAPGGY